MNAEATIPKHLRYIPVGMTTRYKKKAKGLLTGVCLSKVEDFVPGETTLSIKVTDSSGEIVMEAIHANTKINTHSRDRLEKLIQYIARGPLSNERLEITADDKVKLRLKTPFSDGSTHLLFTPSEFIEKLCALIPPARTHLVRWGGCFAPNSPLRKKITLKPANKKGFEFDEEDGSSGAKANYTWSKMLSRVFKIDVLKCDNCGSKLAPIAAVLDSKSIKRYLLHVGVDSDPPPRIPASYKTYELDFAKPPVDSEPVIVWD